MIICLWATEASSTPLERAAIVAAVIPPTELQSTNRFAFSTQSPRTLDIASAESPPIHVSFFLLSNRSGFQLAPFSTTQLPVLQTFLHLKHPRTHSLACSFSTTPCCVFHIAFSTQLGCPCTFPWPRPIFPTLSPEQLATIPARYSRSHTDFAVHRPSIVRPPGMGQICGVSPSVLRSQGGNDRSIKVQRSTFKATVVFRVFLFFFRYGGSEGGPDFLAPDNAEMITHDTWSSYCSR